MVGENEARIHVIFIVLVCMLWSYNVLIWSFVFVLFYCVLPRLVLYFNICFPGVVEAHVAPECVCLGYVTLVPDCIVLACFGVCISFWFV